MMNYLNFKNLLNRHQNYNSKKHQMKMNDKNNLKY